MNDEDLKNLLLKAKVAAPTPEQTEELVVRVRGAVRREREARVVPERSGQLFFWRWLAGGLAVLVGVLLVARRGPADPVLTEKHVADMRRYLGEIQTLFPNRLDAVVFEAGGPRIVLSDRPVPSGGEPLMIRICAGKGCREIVTFSGKRIEIDGRSFEVLSDSGGGVIVAGDQGVWTSAEADRPGGLPFRVQARHLL